MRDRNPDRRQFLRRVGGTAGIGMLAGCISGGDGDGGDGDFPQRDITSIVHYGEGGYNFYARLVAKYINQKGYLPNDVSVNVQNIEGGGGIVGTNQLYSADPDGYTYGIVNGDSMARSQMAEDAAEYDLAEMTPFPKIAGSLPCLAVRQDSDIQNADDLISAFQAGDFKLAEFSWGSTTGMSIISLGRVGGLIDNPVEKLGNNTIIYGGRGEAITAMKRGEVEIDGGSYSSVLPFVESDDLRMILVLSDEDEPPEQTPDAETLRDLDIDNPQEVISFIGSTWHRIFLGPPDIPDDRASVVDDAITQAIQDPDLQEEAGGNDRPVTYASSDEVEQGVENMIQTWQDNQEVLDLLEQHRPS